MEVRSFRLRFEKGDLTPSIVYSSHSIPRNWNGGPSCSVSHFKICYPSILKKLVVLLAECATRPMYVMENLVEVPMTNLVKRSREETIVFHRIFGLPWGDY